MDFNFKGFYDEIIFDVDRSILKSYTGKQGDTKSRGLYVTVTQKNAVIDDLTGLSMRLFYEKPDKTRGFIDGVVDGSKFRIDYTNQMYAVPGVVTAELRLTGPDGEIITAKTFKILVDSSIADGSIVSENERGILDRAFELAEDIIPRLELLDVELLEDVQNEMLQGQLKVAKVEKELNDYKATMQQINIHQSPTQKASGHGIVSLPPNAAEGQVSVTVKGNTEVDELGNVKSTVGAFRQKSVGKNIFDGEMINAFIDTETGQPVSRETSVCSKNFTPIIPGETYIFSQHSKGKHVNYFIYDAKKNYVRHIYASAGTSVTFADNEYYIKIGYPSGYQDVEELQIEKGSVVTSYEPYQESNIYVLAKDLETGEILKLRSLPNGTKDEVDIARGMLIKRVSDKVVIDGNMEWSAFTVIGSDNDVYRMSVTAHYIKNKLPNSYNGGVTYGYMVGINDIHTFETGQFNVTHGSSYKIAFNLTGDFFITIDKDYLDTTYGGTLNGFKSYLNDHPITLIYQLAEPIKIPVQVSGSIVSYPNGTIYIERILPDAGVYTDKISVLHQDAPIKRLDRLSKVDFYTGVETELDVSEAVIAEDKLSFTHPDLSEGDIVFFEYEYDVESTDGEAEVEFYDSRYVVKDTETGKFYKWNIVVANGQPSIELVEV